MDASIRKRGISYLTDIMKKIAVMEGHLLSGVSYAGWGIPSGTDFTKEELTQNSVICMKELAKIAESLDIVYGVEAVNRFEGVVLNTAKDCRALC